MSDSATTLKSSPITQLPDLEYLLRFNGSKNDISSMILGYLNTKEMKEFRLVNTFCEEVINARLFENSKLSINLRRDESICVFERFLHKFIGKPAQVKVTLGCNPKAKALLKCWLRTNNRNILSLEVDFMGSIDYDLFGDFLPNLKNLFIFAPILRRRCVSLEELDPLAEDSDTISSQDSNTILSNLETLRIPFVAFRHRPFAKWFAKVEKRNLKNMYSAWWFDHYPTDDVINYYAESFLFFMTPRYFNWDLTSLWMTASVEGPETQ